MLAAFCHEIFQFLWNFSICFSLIYSPFVWLRLFNLFQVKGPVGLDAKEVILTRRKSGACVSKLVFK